MKKNKDNVSVKTAKLLKSKGYKCSDDDPISLWDAQKWLRHKHINIYIEWGMDGYNFNLEIKDEDGMFIEKSYDDYYKTYEKCLDKAIFKALKFIPNNYYE